MRWIRTYTENEDVTLKSGRPVVWDPAHCEPFYLSGFDYLPLFRQLDGPAVIIEWDLAISREDRARFEGHCRASPGLVQVAPYPHYEYKPAGWERGWVHRDGDATVCSIPEGQPDAMFFGFGLVYFPYWIIRAFLADIARPLPELAAARGTPLAVMLGSGAVTDVVFSAWHWEATGHRVPVHWDVRPVHLNYQA